MRIFFLILLTILFFGCKKDDKIPKGIIPQNQMRRLMWDMMRADAYVSDFIMKDSSKNQRQESAILYEEIFKIHSTTRDVFKKSLAYYQSRPDKFKTITDSLRVDEKNAMEYQNYIRPQLDTTIRKLKLKKKLTEAGE